MSGIMLHDYLDLQNVTNVCYSPLGRSCETFGFVVETTESDVNCAQATGKKGRKLRLDL